MGVQRRPAISIVVPVRDAEKTLDVTLSAIRKCSLPVDSYELIAVDDASIDHSVAIAARYADTVIRLGGTASGPAYARNRGAEVARGDLIAFIDADVVVGAETLGRMMSALDESADVDAVSAGRDVRPTGTNFLSQYWNLVQRFGEESERAGAAYFTPHCAMIRRSVLFASGMYDEWRFATAGVEGTELGQRLGGAGRRLVLAPEIVASHTKRWNLLSVSKVVWKRSVLLARSLGYERTRAMAPGDVVVTLTRALAPALAVITAATLMAAFLPRPYIVLKVSIAIAAVLLTNLPLHRFFLRTRGIAFTLFAAPVHLLIQLVSAVGLCVGWLLRDTVGDVLPDAATQAYSEVGLEVWPPVRRRPS